MNKTFFIVAILVSNFGFAQNLVPNPSFEIYDTCPSDFSQPTPWMYEINHAAGWVSPTLATSDYFNSCNLLSVGTPNNLAGYQPPLSGEAYAGFGLEYDSFGPPQWYEYIQIKLTEPLKTDRSYKISFYVSLAEVFSDYATASIGAMASLNGLSSTTSEPQILFNPQIRSNYFLTDTTEWMKIEGEYLAEGGEVFLTIGYFSNQNSIDTTSYKAGSPTESFFIYYYIDLVEVIEIPQSMKVPNIITPNNDAVNDFFQFDFTFDEVVILNRWGQIVFENDDNDLFWDGKTISGNEVPEGTYYYVITTKKETFKGFVQVVR